MREKEPEFDRNKHLIYSSECRKVILNHLHRHYPDAQAEQLWKDIRRDYCTVVDLIPYLGGKKNSQSQAVYDCAALFSYYRCVPQKPSLQEFSEMNEELFVPTFTRLGFLDLNRPLLMKVADGIWRHLARVNAEKREEWPGNYIMEMVSCCEGSKYVFQRCPIAELAKKLQLSEMMPAMCNPDYPMLKAIHGGLIRKSTCANGDCCDFWIVPDQSRLLEKYPCHRDERGFITNETEE